LCHEISFNCSKTGFISLNSKDISAQLQPKTFYTFVNRFKSILQSCCIHQNDPGLVVYVVPSTHESTNPAKTIDIYRFCKNMFSNAAIFTFIGSV
jgi:hypothetical protein